VKDLRSEIKTLLLLPVTLSMVLQFNCAPAIPAEQGREVLEEAAQAMGGLEALGAVENITRQGTTQPSSLGQARSTRERLYVQPERPYTLTIDFTVPREVQLSGTRQTKRVIDWEKGGYRESRETIFPLEPRHLNGARQEWDRDISRFLVDALGAGSTVQGISESEVEGSPHLVVSVNYTDGLLYQVYVDDSTHLVTQLEFTEDRNPFGDVAKQKIFSDYRQVGTLVLPFSEITTEMGETTLVRKWIEITVNDELQEDQFEIPVELQERARSLAHADTVPVIPIEIAAGVYFGEGIGNNSMWIEFQDFILVVEGPNNEMQSLEAIRQIRETLGDKPIQYLVTTHHHADHTGGIRTFAAEGAIIITHASNEEVIREILTLPHNLNPDRLAQSQQEPQIEMVEDRRTISDGSRTVELVHLANEHADGTLLIYLPRERVVFESDMFEILQGDVGPPALRPEARVFYDGVRELGWSVNQIAPGHGRLVEWSELVDALSGSE
jgi:glyoxylase-like metal-dependent hydrolase (beta-lactamase superfamily II)